MNQNKISAKRAAATAGPFSVWILELEPRSVETRNVIDHGSADIPCADWVDDDLHRVMGQSNVAHALFLVEINAVLVPGTSATND